MPGVILVGGSLGPEASAMPARARGRSGCLPLSAPLAPALVRGSEPRASRRWWPELAGRGGARNLARKKLDFT